jgi:hypothetical protein
MHSLNRISDKNNTKNSRNHETHTSRLHEAKSSCQAETETRTTRILPNSATNTAELRSQQDTTQPGTHYTHYTHYTHFGGSKRRKKGKGTTRTKQRDQIWIGSYKQA